MVNKGVGSHGQFDRLYVLPVRDRDHPLHCRCFYLSGISLVQEMAGEMRLIESSRAANTPRISIVASIINFPTLQVGYYFIFV